MSRLEAESDVASLRRAQTYESDLATGEEALDAKRAPRADTPLEGRSFRGWHHHVSVVLCCYAFIVSERVRRFPAINQLAHYSLAVAAVAKAKSVSAEHVTAALAEVS